MLAVRVHSSGAVVLANIDNVRATLEWNVKAPGKIGAVNTFTAGVLSSCFPESKLSAGWSLDTQKLNCNVSAQGGVTRLWSAIQGSCS